MNSGVFVIVIGSEQMGLYGRMCVTVGVCSVYRGGEQANTNCKDPKTAWLVETHYIFMRATRRRWDRATVMASMVWKGSRAPSRLWLLIDEL